MAKLDSKVDISPILESIERTRKINNDGTVSFTGFDFGETSTALSSFITFDSEIPKAQKNHIVTQTVFRAARQNAISRQRFLKSLNQEEKNYINKPLTDFYLLSSLSLGWRPEFRRVYSGRQIITFSEEYPKGFPRDELDIDRAIAKKEEATTGFSRIRIKVKSRCEYGAFEKASDHIDYIRGIWNWRLCLLYTSPSPRDRG